MSKFFGNSTLKRLYVGTITKPSGGGVSAPLPLPRTGILAKIWLIITGTVSGTVTTPDAGGFAKVINRCRVVAQGGQDMINVSGMGYHYLYRRMIDIGRDILASQSAYAAVTATTFNVSMQLPIQVNPNDEAGLFNLQTEDTLVQVNLDWFPDASLVTAGGATYTATAKVYIDVYTVPTDPAAMPDLSLVHQVLEDSRSEAAAGVATYEWPRGSIYLRMLHGAGIAQSGSDAWSAFQVVRNESDVILDYPDTSIMDQVHGNQHGTLTRFPGVAYWAGLDESGFGSFGAAGNVIDSSKLTNIKTRVTLTGATTLYAVRDTLLPVAQG